MKWLGVPALRTSKGITTGYGPVVPSIVYEIRKENTFSTQFQADVLAFAAICFLRRINATKGRSMRLRGLTVASRCLIAKLLFLVLPIFLGSFAYTQSMSASGSGTDEPSLISNFPDVLVGGGGVNAWHTMKIGGSKVFASQGKVVALDSSGCAYLYAEYPSNTWTQQTAWGCGLVKVLYGGDGNIYSLKGSCGSYPWISKWTGSAWAPTNGCGPDFSLDPQGGSMSVAIGTSTAIWVSTTYWASGTQVNGCSDRGGALSVAMMSTSQKTFVVACHDNTIWMGVWGGSNTVTYTQFPGAGPIVTASGDGSIYVIGTDNNIYRWNTTANNWDHIVGSGFTALASAGDSEWTVGPPNGGYTVYRLSNLGISDAYTYSGSVSCNVPPPYGQTLCATFHHSVVAQAKIGSNIGSQATSQFQGPGGWGVTSTVHKNDIFDCMEGSADCDIGSTGNMACSGGGSNNTQSVSVSAQAEVAFTQVKWPGSPAPSCAPNGGCIYTVQWNCTAATTPPDYMVGSVKSGNYVGIATDIRWRALSPCLRFIVNGIHGPWGCYGGLFPLNSWMVAMNDPPYPAYACTHNP